MGNTATGGSCFIGLDSWKPEANNDTITPYNGWSKGIYYGNKEDALGLEQALVIADIDPLMMSLGKPRPQALPVPMRLVAYLPVLEFTQALKSEDNKKKIETYRKALSEIDTIKVYDIANPNTSNMKKLKDSLYEMFSLHRDIDTPCKKRIKHWENHWASSPIFGIPPVFTDWIGVQLESIDTFSSRCDEEKTDVWFDKKE